MGDWLLTAFCVVLLAVCASTLQGCLGDEPQYACFRLKVGNGTIVRAKVDRPAVVECDAGFMPTPVAKRIRCLAQFKPCPGIEDEMCPNGYAFSLPNATGFHDSSEVNRTSPSRLEKITSILRSSRRLRGFHGKGWSWKKAVLRTDVCMPSVFNITNVTTSSSETVSSTSTSPPSTTSTRPSSTNTTPAANSSKTQSVMSNSTNTSVPTQKSSQDTSGSSVPTQRLYQQSNVFPEVPDEGDSVVSLSTRSRVTPSKGKLKRTFNVFDFTGQGPSLGVGLLFLMACTARVWTTFSAARRSSHQEPAFPNFPFQDDDTD